ncbi:hypothetical protein [Rickettsia sp. TH2014]|uniref:hypothetical protein n=1 Tax=Rickettsia sp. TH2014 TaxID=1967503 RepID=UPI001C4757ED|nr:hypothetical protein [Rickettsia sp. TH2014]
MRSKDYINKVVNHSQKASSSVKKYFWRVWALDKMMTCSLIMSLSTLMIPNLNDVITLFIIIMLGFGFYIIVASLFDYGGKKVLGHFRKTKSEVANVGQNNPVIFGDSLDELTSNLYALGFKLNARIGEYYLYKSRNFILPNGDFLVKEVGGVCRIYSTRFDLILRLTKYINLQFSNNYKDIEQKDNADNYST